jgi:hypothetical protein
VASRDEQDRRRFIRATCSGWAPRAPTVTWSGRRHRGRDQRDRRAQNYVVAEK